MKIKAIRLQYISPTEKNVQLLIAIYSLPLMTSMSINFFGPTANVVIINTHIKE